MSRFSLPTTEKTLFEDLPPVDPNALREFAAGAKDHRADQEPLPWDKFDPDALPKNNVSVRLNDYQLAMLQYLAKRSEVSQQKILNRILIPSIEEQAQESASRR